VTLDDVARAAGVSRATASRALTGSGPASQVACERVRAVAAELGFTPNQAARALASNRAHAVALVIPEMNTLVLGDPFLGGMITGVSEAFHDTDYQLILVIVRPDEAPTKAWRLLQSSYVDGAIVVSHHRGGDLEQAIGQQAAPMVHVGRPWQIETTTYVDVDNARSGRLAAQRLLQRGAQRIVCVAGPQDMTPACDRVDGWRTALVEAGMPVGPIEHGPFTLRGGAEAMQRLLAQTDRIDGVFAQSDLMAAGAVQVLQAAGHIVGDDVYVVSVDDSEVARTTTPRLSSVTNPAAEMAMRASHMLLRILDDGISPADIAPEIVEPTLVLRESA